ncbi:MAG: glycosyltransferase [Chloroflexi bacterium]|nr:glycosyltransferase [Chloroflexota bacterium]
MKILFLTPDVPFPADQGAKIRNLALIRAAAAHHQVDLVSFGNGSSGRGSFERGSFERGSSGHGSSGADPEGPLQKIVRRLAVVPAPPARPMLTRVWGLFFGTLPDLALRLESAAFVDALQEMVQGQRYDVVQIEGLEMMAYLPVVRALIPKAAVIYDAHNAEMSLQRSMFQVEFREPGRWHAAFYSFAQWSKLGSYERITMNDSDMVLSVSEADLAKLRGRRTVPELVPNAVDPAAIEYREPAQVAGRRLFFVGPADYRPNADAIRWFIAAVLPQLRKLLPDVELRLAGRGTERFTAPGVEGLGHVEDAHAELRRADAFVAPIRMGGGTRFKILEAMAAGVPVVSTPLGVGGIAVESGQHALVASSPQDFARAVHRLLTDRPYARQLSEEARRLVEARYAWNKVTPGYLRLLAQARRAAK